MSQGKRHARVRAVLAGSTALWLAGMPNSALAGPDPCTLSGQTRTCTGDQSGGITETTVRRLQVRDLTADIAPASGPGIRLFRNNSNVELVSDTGEHAIRTTGNGATGVHASSNYASASIVHTGDIETNGTGSWGIVAGSGDYYAFESVNIDVRGGTIATQGPNSGGISGSASRYSIVEIANRADIATQGKSSPGISAAAGNSAFISNHGDITTEGDSSSAMAAGSNYEAVGMSNTGRIVTRGAGSAGLGASGYNSAGITNSGDVETFGDRGRGIIAGAFTYTGGVANSGSVVTHGDDAPAIAASSQYGIGQVLHTGTVRTEGDRSTAIQASSYYSRASVTAQGAVTTTGDSSHGIVASSSGRYGSVDVALTGPLSTAGLSSRGIDAYSYAGAIGIVVSGDEGGILTSGDGSDAIRARSGGWNYTFLDFDIHADIETRGDGAAGIRVDTQSDFTRIDLTARIVTSGDTAAGVTVAAYNGAIDALIYGAIETSGTDSHGISFASDSFSSGQVTVAQGGAIRTTGAGAAGVRMRQGYGGFTLINRGVIATSGDGAHAIDAALAGNPYSYPSRLTLDNQGELTASGADASAISLVTFDEGDFTNSGTITGGGGQGAAIRVIGGQVTLVNTGDITATSGLALDFQEGEDPDEGGSTATLLAAAAEAPSPGHMVDNGGTITGDVRINGGTFLNRSGALLRAGGVLDLGPGGSFTNTGTVHVAGAGSIGTTAMTGNFAQAPGGVLVFDLDLTAGTADRLTVSGNAEIDGLIRLNPINGVPSDPVPRTYAPVALVTAGSLDAEGAALEADGLEVSDTVAYDFELSVSAQTLWLEIVKAVTRFEPLVAGAASPNQLATALYLDRIADGGGAGSVAALTGSLFMEADVPALLSRLDLLAAPSPLVLTQLAERSLRRQFDGETCLAETGPETGKACIALAFEHEDGDGEVAETGQSFDGRNRRLTVSLGYGLAPDWAISASLSHGDTKFSAPWLTQGDGRMLTGMVRLDGKLGGVEIGLSAALQDFDADLSRLAAQRGAAALASDQQVRSYGAQLKLAYSLAIGGASLVPSIAGAYTCHDHSGFAERGGAVEALTVAGHSQCDAGLIPGLALRVPLGSSASGPAKVWFDLGASGQVIKADALTWNSAIAAAGGTSGSFRSRYGFDNRYARAGGGITASLTPALTLRAFADTRQGADYDDWSVGASARLRF